MKRLAMIVPVMLVFACIPLLAAGCGGRSGRTVEGVKVKGQVVNNGRPIQFLPNEQIQVQFIEMEGSEEEQIREQVDVGPDGTFTINGPTDQGIPAGKYRLTLSSMAPEREGDRFEEAFGEHSTTLVAEVGSEEGQTLIIDVGRKTVTKK